MTPLYHNVNCLGVNGSILPLFIKICSTIDEDIIPYFYSPEENSFNIDP